MLQYCSKVYHPYSQIPLKLEIHFEGPESLPISPAARQNSVRRRPTVRRRLKVTNIKRKPAFSFGGRKLVCFSISRGRFGSCFGVHVVPFGVPFELFAVEFFCLPSILVWFEIFSVFCFFDDRTVEVYIVWSDCKWNSVICSCLITILAVLNC